MHDPLNIRLWPSSLLLCYLVGLHLLAMASLLQLDFSVWLHVLGLSLLLCHGVFCWRRYCAVYGQERALQLSFAGERWGLLCDGVVSEYHLKTVTIWPWFVVMSLIVPATNKSLYLIVCVDSCSKDDFRRLRVRLNHRRSFASTLTPSD